jgi:hypothetical protein
MLLRVFEKAQLLNNLSGREAQFGGQFRKIAGFYANIKKMSVDKIFPDLLISVTDLGKPDFVPLIGFQNDVQIFRFSGPTFDVVPFHAFLRSYYRKKSTACLQKKQRDLAPPARRCFKARGCNGLKSAACFDSFRSQFFHEFCCKFRRCNKFFNDRFPSGDHKFLFCGRRYRVAVRIFNAFRLRDFRNVFKNPFLP